MDCLMKEVEGGLSGWGSRRLFYQLPVTPSILVDNIPRGIFDMKSNQQRHRKFFKHLL